MVGKISQLNRMCVKLNIASNVSVRQISALTFLLSIRFRKIGETIQLSFRHIPIRFATGVRRSVSVSPGSSKLIKQWRRWDSFD